MCLNAPQADKKHRNPQRRDHVDTAPGEVEGGVAAHATASPRNNRGSRRHGFDCLTCHVNAPFLFCDLLITMLEYFASVSNDIYPLNPANRL